MQLLTDEASEQLSRGVSVITDRFLGVCVILLFAVSMYSPVGSVLSETSVAVVLWKWLWTDQTPAYLVSSVLAVLLLSVESSLSESTETDESNEESETRGLWGNLSATFNQTVRANAVTVIVLSGVVAGVLVSEAVGAPLSVAAAFVYPVVDVRVAQKTEWVPTPIVAGAALSAPLAVVPTLYTVPIHVGATASKRFASVVDSATDGFLFLATRVTGAVPGAFQPPARLSPRR